MTPEQLPFQSSPLPRAVLQFGPLLRTGGIWREVEAAEASDVFVRIVASLTGTAPVTSRKFGKQPEESATITPAGNGFALSYCGSGIVPGCLTGAIALILLRDAMRFPGMPVDDVPVTRLLFLVAPSPQAQMNLVQRLRRFLSDSSLRRVLETVPTDEELHQVFDAADADQGAESNSREPD